MSKIKKLFTNLKDFKFSLFFALCFLSLFPAIYEIIKTYLISTTSNSAGIDIIGQMEWFDLIDETIRAFLIIPLYSLLNRILKKDKENFSKNVFKTGILTCIIYTLFSIVIFIYGIKLVGYMNPEEVDIHVVFQYLSLETIAFTIGIIPSFINVIFVVIGKARNVYIFLIIKVLIGIVCDLTLIPHLGVNGVAISNIVSNVVMSIGGILLLIKGRYILPCLLHISDFPLLMSWIQIGASSGGGQFLDNIVYALMVSKMVNSVSEQGNYWAANNFIWQLLLIPILALSEVIKHDCKNEYRELNKSNYYMIAFFSVLIWAVFIPFYSSFFKNIEQLGNYQMITSITLKLLPFYIFYAISIIPDSIFVGYGKTSYTFITSLIVNIFYYGVFYILYITNNITMDMNTIILMFGFGIVLHSIVGIIEMFIFSNRTSKNIQKNIDEI